MPATATVDSKMSYCTSEKRVSQWEELMRKFSRAHKEECRTVSLNIPRAHRSTKYFPTGSQYEGTWDVLGMSGYGIYTFPNGVIYEGDFDDGMFHGAGQLRYKDGTTVKGQFNKGVMTDRKLTFADGLEYDEHNWMYCKMPDRRYTVEYDEGLAPAGKSNITAEMPPREIPPGFYDSGDGFFNPTMKSVYKPTDPTAILRSPSEREQKWIIANCRQAPEPNMGPSQFLYEMWSEPELKLPPAPKPAASTRFQPTSRHSFFEHELDYFQGTNFYNPDQPFPITNRWSDHLNTCDSSVTDDELLSFKILNDDDNQTNSSQNSDDEIIPHTLNQYLEISNSDFEILSPSIDDVDTKLDFTFKTDVDSKSSSKSSIMQTSGNADAQLPNTSKKYCDEAKMRINQNLGLMSSVITYKNVDDANTISYKASRHVSGIKVKTWQSELNKLFKQKLMFPKRLNKLNK